MSTLAAIGRMLLIGAGLLAWAITGVLAWPHLMLCALFGARPLGFSQQ